MTNKQFVQSERTYLVELLKGFKPSQWKAITLCGGWNVEDLAAHIVVREGLIGPIGIVVPRLHNLHDSRVKKLEAKGHSAIIQKLEKYPWFMPAVVNTGEFWVHNEDILRGALHIKRPVATAKQNAILWSSLQGLAKIKKGLVKDLGNVVLKNEHTAEVITIANHKSKNDTNITGQAGELLLYFYGRRDVAKVSIKKAP